MKQVSDIFRQPYPALLRKNPLQETEIDDFFHQLTSKVPENGEALRNCLDKWDNFIGRIQDVQNLYYFQYLSALNDTDKLASYQAFLQKSQATIARWEQKLHHWLKESEALHATLPDVYQVFISDLSTPQKPDSAPLRSALRQTAGKHPQRLMAARIEFAGQKNSPQEIAAVMRSPDRGSREAAWHATNAARRADVSFFQELFDEQLRLRHELAVAGGKANYIEYRFEELNRPASQVNESLRIHQTMEKHLPDFLSQMYQEYKKMMDWDRVHPWDLACGPGVPQATPDTEAELLDSIFILLEQLHPDWAEAVKEMQEKERLNLMRQPNKSPGAMTYQMKADKWPLVMAAYEGSGQGLTQVIHELGHAIHFYLSETQPLKSLMPISSEAGEWVALSFELLLLSRRELFFSAQKGQELAMYAQLYRIFSLLAMTLTLDAFQHEVYRHPEMSHEGRNACWLQQYYRFHGREVDWEPFEEELAQGWLRHFHLFEAPFYSMEYVLAQFGALQLWQAFEKEPKETIHHLHHIMERGNSQPVADLYAVMGLSLFPKEKTMEDLLHFCLQKFST